MSSARHVSIAFLALLTWTAARAQSSPNPTHPAACHSSPDLLKGMRVPSYLDDSIPQLRQEVPALRGLKAAADPKGAEASPEDETASILSQSGAAVAAMLPRIPNLVANEEISEARLPLPYMESDNRRVTSMGRRLSAPAEYSSTSRPVGDTELQEILHNQLDSSHQISRFSYRLQSTSDPTVGWILEEYRTDTSNASVAITSGSPANPNGIGFGNSWLLLLPANQLESHFRLLGHQKINQHETIVLAYAQAPERVRLPAEIQVPSGRCSFFTQGVIWIDESMFQVVRLETDLLTPLPGIELKRLRSELSFSEVRIPERNLMLWLPSQVEISWMMNDLVGGELHRYSKYKLFTATSRMVIPKD